MRFLGEMLFFAIIAILTTLFVNHTNLDPFSKGMICGFECVFVPTVYYAIKCLKYLKDN